MRVLADEGLIYRVPGLGYYVSFGISRPTPPLEPEDP
jgi:DNA-binding GntR family transcriptional regulator